MTQTSRGHGDVCLMVPAGRWDLLPLVSAIRQHHGDIAIHAVWCGDPHLRPVLPGAVEWCDVGLDEPSAVGWNRLLVALNDEHYEWCRTAAAVRRLLDDDVSSVLVLRVGATAVLGAVPEGLLGGAVTLVPRLIDGTLPADGLAPSEADLIAFGRHSTAIAAFGPGSGEALEWLRANAAASVGLDQPIGPWFDRLAELFGAMRCVDPSVVVAGWRALRAGDPTPVLLDLTQLDRDEPWHFTFGAGQARVRLSDDAALAAAVRAVADQTAGEPTPLTLPGGISVAGAVRAAVADAIRGWRLGDNDLPPAPFGAQNSEFRTWLARPQPGGAAVGRYWLGLHADRADLAVSFPQPGGLDAMRFSEWIEASWALDRQSVLLLEPSSGAGTVIAQPDRIESGFNVLGYLDFDLALGDVARRILIALDAAGVPAVGLNYARSTTSPLRGDTPGDSRDDIARYDTNIVVVTAAQFPFVVADHGESLLACRRTIGYWFWELEYVPPAMVHAIDFVDEIWTGSQFVAQAFARVTTKPVRAVPLPVAEPRPSARDRHSFGVPADRFVFLCTFDSFSVPERKNPFGAITAFRQAFADGEGPLLWIKTMNGDKGWRIHERLLLAAAGRTDIIVHDEHLSRADQMAVLANADCLVSLHRAEGLGLHCAEAMWLGKPVIATRYSGNLDFMDDSCAALIDYELVPVRHGEGIYPPEAMWAEPDLAQASAWMRRVASDSRLADDLGAQGRQRMTRQPSMRDAGRAMAERAHIVAPEGTSSWV